MATAFSLRLQNEQLYTELIKLLTWRFLSFFDDCSSFFVDGVKAEHVLEELLDLIKVCAVELPPDFLFS